MEASIGSAVWCPNKAEDLVANGRRYQAQNEDYLDGFVEQTGESIPADS